jgi:hypothetical protein
MDCYSVVQILEHGSGRIYINKTAIINKQFHYSNTVYFNNDLGKQGTLSLFVITAAPVVRVIAA